MTHWNYRIMRRKGYYGDGEVHYGIYEVYYADDGSVDGWTDRPMEPNGQTLDEIEGDMIYMKMAFDHPVLDYETGKDVNS